MYAFARHNKQLYPNYATKVVVNHYYSREEVPIIGASSVCTFTKYVSNGGGSSAESAAIHELVINPTVNKILDYLKEFSKGNFANVRDVFSQFAILSAELYDLKNRHTNFADYEFIRNSIVTSFESYIQSIYQYVNISTLEGKLVNASSMVDILQDFAKLEAYVKDLNTRGRVGEIFPEVTVTAPLFKLKPEYEAYIAAYGFPEGAVFNPDLLAPFIIAQQ